MSIVLNLISLLAGSAATIIGVGEGVKWRNGNFTKRGWTLVGLALLVLCVQIWLQILNRNLLIEAEALSERYREVVSLAYTGWIGAGRYRDGAYTEYHLANTIPPEGFKAGMDVSIGNSQTQFLFLRDSPSDHCLKDVLDALSPWNVFGRGSPVEVLDVKVITCAEGTQEVWLRVRPFVP
jgi:hypothetical protein